MNAALVPALKQLAEAGGSWCLNLSVGEAEPFWMQVLPDCVNFYYPYDDDPLARLRLPLPLPPETNLLGFQAGTYATLGFGAWNMDRVAALVDALLARFYGLPDDQPLTAALEDLG
ncbi:MAG: hypothetical protein JO332_13380 [Planctomycetaceae bacterium]|nr:hypothetical protein [Planctomycetaceae bacterium]